MANKKLTDAELEGLFENIGGDDASAANASASASASKPAPPPAAAVTDDHTAAKASAGGGDDSEDVLAELSKNLATRPAAAPISRSSTPHISTISSSAASLHQKTPPSSRSGRSSEEKPAAAFASDPQPQGAAPAAGGSWWGGISSFATAAVKQARGAVEEIQKNEEAAKWAEQVRGNYGALKGLGDDLRSRAVPTFTTLLHTLAPPISQHERLQIHITHDIVGYPSLDPLVYRTFSRVMSQVEGGDLLVIQRGSDSTHRRPSDAAYAGSGTSGWTDGPWWREPAAQRAMNPVPGLVEGSKLARASAESYAAEYYNARGGVEQAAKQATASVSEANPVRSSDIFVAVQPIAHTEQAELFARAADKTTAAAAADDDAAPQLCFAVYLHDPVHSIDFAVLSQSLPHKWADWLDASAAPPAEIAAIVDSGGVDPREWAAEWVEETLGLAVGAVAQRYVARRMGVGDGGLGRSRRRDEAVEGGGGEAARAI